MALYFSHQPSGGRGEYELAGVSGDVSAATLDGHGFLLDTITFGVKDTDLILSDQGGKRRLRSTAASPMLIQRQVGALLCLPKSTRDRSRVSNGQPVMIDGRYVLDEIHLAAPVVSPG